MNARFTVVFEGFAAKQAAALEAMLRADIARYPERLEMDAAYIEKENAHAEPGLDEPGERAGEPAPEVQEEALGEDPAD